MGRRVLVECDVTLTALDRVEALEQAGFEVECCTGPHHRHCPVLTGGRCDAVTAADVVVTVLADRGLDVAAGVTAAHAGTPHVTLLSRFDSDAVPADGGLGTVLPDDVDDVLLVAAVRQALAAGAGGKGTP